MSLVDMQPSESTRSKVAGGPQRNASSSTVASAIASVVSTQSMVAIAGASIPAPFAIPPTFQPAPAITAFFGRVSVVMIAAAAAGPPSAESPPRGPHPGQQLVHRQPLADQAGRADRDLAGADTPVPTAAQRAAVRSAVAWVSWKPGAPVQALAPPELRTTARELGRH